jgi:CheY-like chemotaxis protein
MGQISGQQLDILLVEDNEADIKLTLIAFESGNFPNRIHVVQDGEEALNYIYGRGNFEDREKYPVPDIILLDINLPKFNGFTVLKQLKNDPEFHKIPVIILTSSSYENDIASSYNFGATSYIQKPVDFEEFYEIVSGFNTYWHKINKLPQKIQ